MHPKVLFVVGDTGSASYCMPLWEKWKNKKKNNWKILGEDYVVKALNLYKYSEELIDNYNKKISFEKNLEFLNWKPDIIFCSATFKKIETDSIIYSKNKNLKGIQFFDTWYNYYKRLVKIDNKILAKKVCVINKTAIRDAVLEGVDKKRLVIIGQPYFEKIRVKKTKKPPNNNIMFINQPISKYKELGFLNYDEKDVWDILLPAMKKVRSKYKNFYFAMHPQENKISLKKKIIKDLNITFLRNGQEGLEQSDTILGIFSSLMIDAFFINKKVVSIQPKFRTRNLCILSKAKYIELTSDESELVNYLRVGKKIENNTTNILQKSMVGSLKRLELLLGNEKKN